MTKTDLKNRKTARELLDVVPCDDCPLGYTDCIYCKACGDYEDWVRIYQRALEREALRAMSDYYCVSFGYGWGVWVKR